MKADEILEKIPESAIKLYGIKVKVNKYTGTNFLYFESQHLTICCERITEVENRSGWVDIRTNIYVTVMFNIDFNCFLITIV